jgi:hypothetical protein
MTRFAKFAWFTLAYNILVILWGVFPPCVEIG